MQGRFITVEGVEGAGKSTNIQYLLDSLRSHGIDAIHTREPGGTDYAEAIRELLLAPRDEPVAPLTELLLMFAARAQHLKALILPALDEGKWVVCDRFTDATYAYQGGGREMGFELVASLEQLVQGDFRPHCTLVLDLPVDQGMKRVGQRGDKDRFEQEQLDFFERVRDAYHQLIAMNPQRYRLVDASVSLDQVRIQLDQIVGELVNQWQAST